MGQEADGRRNADLQAQAWHARRVPRDLSIQVDPAHAAIGMRILGPFLSIEDPDSFFFMRGFPDLESREPMKAKFYDGPLWKNEL